MRVIVQHEENVSGYLAQYGMNIEYISQSYKAMDIEEKYLPWLSEIAQCIEPNFTIELCQVECVIESAFNNNKIILASIGIKKNNHQIDQYYNMTTHTLEHTDKVRSPDSYQWINCYSENDKTDAEEYIKCICYLKSLASECHTPIIIYASRYVPDETYRYRSLTYKIVSSFLADIDGVLITRAIKEEVSKYYTPSQARYEFYLEHTVYLEDSLNDAVVKAIPFLHTSKSQIRFRNIYKAHRQKDMLYDDVFYETIGPDQEIYVPLNLGNFREPEDYQALGIEHIPLIGDYGMLYAKRSKFDELREELRLEVINSYYMPILSHQPCDRSDIGPNFSYELVPKNLKYKGKGAYIGIIAVDDVDYTNVTLRTKDGSSRIACIWEQIRTNEGTYYSKEQINEELKSSNPGQIIKLPDSNSTSTIMLGIAGGKSENPGYRGIATEAEFLVAKVNSAPEELQKIYGGTPSREAITMADALIGTLKLISFAKEKGKPLVLCIPFNTNIDPHDGSLLLYEMLGLIAEREYLTIIIPGGEEADKKHHYSIKGKQSSPTTINLIVEKESQNVIGVIYQKFTNIFETLLYPPYGVSDQPINLKIAGITHLKGTTIYSNGYKISFFNGAIRVLFRLDNPQLGVWRIELKSDTELLSQIDLWISQQELNGYITLNPDNPFITIGSLGNTYDVMTVGGYDKDSMVVQKSSGRGYSWDNRVKPLFITHATHIIAPCEGSKWVSTTGTLSAASIMLGTAAAIYSKCIAEKVFPFPNTLVMNSIIMGMLKQFEEVEYPNPSQGYGIYDIQTLNEFLSNPFVL